jgi:vancomycin aglycone glucosyltransferase
VTPGNTLPLVSRTTPVRRPGGCPDTMTPPTSAIRQTTPPMVSSARGTRANLVRCMTHAGRSPTLRLFKSEQPPPWCPSTGCRTGAVQCGVRFLLSTIGSRGDVQPLVALATELRALEQEVRFCVPPDFQDWIEGLGFPVVPIGPNLREAMADAPQAPPVPPSRELRRQLADATVTVQFVTLAAAAQGCDLIVAMAAIQVAARSVAERLGIGYVFVTYCPVLLPSVHHPPPELWGVPGEPESTAGGNDHLWEREARLFNEAFGPALNAHRALMGLDPVDDVRRHILTDHPFLAADPVLSPWPEPESGAMTQTGAWVIADDRPLAPDLTAFLAAGEPPVYFGFGSMRAPHDLGEVMLQAARAAGRRAIVSRGWAQLSLEGTGTDWLAIDEVNHAALFRRVAAVVHHGGAGTTTAAALAAAPQVVVPQFYDQPYWAQRVQQLRIGHAHAPGLPTPDSLALALDQALHHDVAARARVVAKMMRRDGARNTAERLLRGDFRRS